MITEQEEGGAMEYFEELLSVRDGEREEREGQEGEEQEDNFEEIAKEELEKLFAKIKKG